MIDWYLGTIGFTYPEWKGSFYPPSLPSGQALSYYSKIFNAVEINTTFYGPQSPAQMQRWMASTPENFRFCVKSPKRITHELRLQSPVENEMRVFVDSLLSLEHKLGAVLLQMPPSFKADQLPQVEQFIQSLPAGEKYSQVRYAFEFRHESWHVPETARQLVDLLSKHQLGWVATDYEDLPVTIHPTTHFLYIRWIGRHNVLPHSGVEVLDRTERLQSWLERIRALQNGVDTIFGFFDNDYAGHSPATCNRMKALVGLPVTASSGDEQGRLF